MWLAVGMPHEDKPINVVMCEDPLHDAADRVGEIVEARDWWRLLFVTAKQVSTATRHIELRCEDSAEDGTHWFVVEVNRKRDTQTVRMVMDGDGRGQPPKFTRENMDMLNKIVALFRESALPEVPR